MWWGASGEQLNPTEDRTISWSLHQPLPTPGWPPYDLLALFPFHTLGISMSNSASISVGAARRALSFLRLLCTEEARRSGQIRSSGVRQTWISIPAWAFSCVKTLRKSDYLSASSSVSSSVRWE